MNGSFRWTLRGSLIDMLRRTRYGPVLAMAPVNAAAFIYRTILGEKARRVNARRSNIAYILDLHEPVQLRIFFGVYDTEEVALLRSFLRSDDVAVDVGAQIGYYTLSFSEIVGRNGRVIAFEPDPRTVSRLRANIELNAFARENVEIVQAALSEKSGIETLYRPTEMLAANNSLHAGLAPAADAIRVETFSLDDYCDANGIARIRVLKIDVEGHEPFVLRGAQRMLRERRIDVVYLEYVPRRLQQLGLGDRWLDESLSGNGYTRIFPRHIPTTDNVFNLLYVAPDFAEPS